MKTFTGWEYLLIDVANQFGLDKKLFEERIQWATDNLNQLEELTDKAETKPLYVKAVLAIRKAQQGIPTGHLVGLDASCSGIQIMSAMTGCKAGGNATGLVDPNKRADAYTETTQVMNQILGGIGVQISRKDAKAALMTSFYGSKKTPKTIFGENTPELNAFYQAAQTVALGPWELLQDLLGSWRPFALVHEWKLPDGFDARVKVMKKKQVRIQVDELQKASFTYEFYENEGAPKGLSNAANVVHSMDAFVLREIHRRCNYDLQMIETVAHILDQALEYPRTPGKPVDETLGYYLKQWRRSTLMSAVILPHINSTNVHHLTCAEIQALTLLVQAMLSHKPFPLVTVHDEFKAHPNNLNQVRYWYKEILADIADSNVLDDLLSQVYQMPGKFNKLSQDLGLSIRDSNYALT